MCCTFSLCLFRVLVGGQVEAGGRMEQTTAAAIEETQTAAEKVR